jgi:hypothetical protein
MKAGKCKKEEQKTSLRKIIFATLQLFVFSSKFHQVKKIRLLK